MRSDEIEAVMEEELSNPPELRVARRLLGAGVSEDALPATPGVDPLVRMSVIHAMRSLRSGEPYRSRWAYNWQAHSQPW